MRSRRYDRYARLRRTPEGLWRLSHPRLAQQYRLNVGVIIEEPMLDIRLQAKGKPAGAGGRVLGHLEEYFLEQLTPGDSFIFAGTVLRFEGIRDTAAYVTREQCERKRKFLPIRAANFRCRPFSLRACARCSPNRRNGRNCPILSANGCASSNGAPFCRNPGNCWSRRFPAAAANISSAIRSRGGSPIRRLGMLLTRRLERLRMRPLGFSANEYALAIWGLRDMGGVDMDRLFDEDMLGDDLNAWLAESALYKRTFRNCAIIAGLIERRHPGREKTGRQVTFSSDLIYDVLRAHEPDHILLRATYEDAGTGLLDVARLGDMLKRIKGQIVIKRLERVSPLAVPALLEIGREMVAGEAHEDILREAEDDLVKEAMRLE